MIFVNDLEPILLELGPLQIHWYGLFFASGIALCYLTVNWIFKREKYKQEHLDSLAMYLFIGLVLGARIGHVFFYNAEYFLSNPVEILKIWNGGLSSHGATIGLFLMYWLWCKVHKVPFAKYPDAFVIGFPITAAFVRLGNFFNSEIVGTPTNGEWGVVFKRLGEDFPRHPEVLYEATLNFAIFILFFFLYKNRYKKTPPMFFMFLYILLYFSGRFTFEFFKELHGLPEEFPLSIGQVLSIPAILAALVYFIFFYPKQKARKA